jgi:hypothetical protein
MVVPDGDLSRSGIDGSAAVSRMVVPAGATCHTPGLVSTSAAMAITSTLAHGAGYLAVTAAAAWLVYTKLGLGMLRKAWINLDLIWAAALITTGILTLVL